MGGRRKVRSRDGIEVKLSIYGVNITRMRSNWNVSHHVSPGVKTRNLGLCEWLLMVLALTLVLLFLPLSIWFCVKVMHLFPVEFTFILVNED